MTSPRVLYIVRVERGGPWDWSKDMREQELWDEHARFMNGLVDAGFIILGGPLDGREHAAEKLSCAEAGPEVVPGDTDAAAGLFDRDVGDEPILGKNVRANADRCAPTCPCVSGEAHQDVARRAVELIPVDEVDAVAGAIPRDLRDYADAEEVISRALQAAVNGKLAPGGDDPTPGGDDPIRDLRQHLFEAPPLAELDAQAQQGLALRFPLHASTQRA